MSNKTPKIYFWVLFIFNISYFFLICLVTYIKNQNDNIFVNSFCRILSITTAFFLLINLLTIVYGGRKYITPNDPKCSENGKKILIHSLIAFWPLWPLILVGSLVLFTKEKVSFNIFDLESITDLLLSQMDDEQKSLICDEIAEMKRMGLNPQQVRMKQLISILSLYWAKLIIWYNHEVGRTKV